MAAKQIYLSLGSNIGDRKENLERALRALERENVSIVRRSSMYETEPQDVVQQSWFFNMVAECEAACFPLQLLATTRRIERELGRARGPGVTRRGPRVIDIDILLFGSATMETPRLTIPHPRMFERRFVLAPLLEIAPDLRHPSTREPLTMFMPAVATQKIQKL